MRAIAAAALAASLAAPLAAQDLTGHGGPVGALAAEGGRVISGSFDTRAILWDGAAVARVLRFHDGAVTAVALLPDGALATGGQDGRVALWGAATAPVRVTAEHRAPVGVIAAAPGGGGRGPRGGRAVAADRSIEPRPDGRGGASRAHRRARGA